MVFDGLNIPAHGEQGISILSPVPYQTFQRNASNQATFNVTGRYSGNPTNIIVIWGSNRVVATLNTANETFSATIPNAYAGQNPVIAYFENDASIKVQSAYVGIGDVIALMGQSNTSGQSPLMQAYSHPTLKAGLFTLANQWQELKDPTHNNPGQSSMYQNVVAITAGGANGSTSMTVASAPGNSLVSGYSQVKLWNGTAFEIKNLTTAYTIGSTTIPLASAITSGTHTQLWWDTYPQNSGGSYWPLLASKIMAQINLPIAFIPCAITATACNSADTTHGNWQPATNHNDTSTLYGAALDRVTKAGGCRYIFWHQGEADVSDNRTSSQYLADLTNFVSNMQADINSATGFTPKLVPVKLQYAYSLNGNTANGTYEAAIQTAQQEAWTANSNYFLPGPDLSSIAIDENTYNDPPSITNDGIHIKRLGDLTSATNLWWSAISSWYTS